MSLYCLCPKQTAPRSTITTELLLSFVMQCRIIVAFVLSCIALSVSAAPTPDLSKGLHLLDREPVRHARTHILSCFLLTLGPVGKRRSCARTRARAGLQDVCVHLVRPLPCSRRSSQFTLLQILTLVFLFDTTLDALEPFVRAVTVSLFCFRCFRLHVGACFAFLDNIWI
ncbi:hypothetical protein C8J57DRAFT_1325841, partial [Mycena rebaudengoi]